MSKKITHEEYKKLLIECWKEIEEDNRRGIPLRDEKARQAAIKRLDEIKLINLLEELIKQFKKNEQNE